jgi:hypothetical protein
MVAERWKADAGESPVLEEGSALWERLDERSVPDLGRVEVRARLKPYLAGLLARIDRKNGWQIAEAIGEDRPQDVQRLLDAAVWDAAAVRDDLRAYGIEHLGVAESGLPKKGNASCGVASQSCVTIGSTTNCQVGVFLGYASRHGMAFLDRMLYLPRLWADDRTRRDVAGIPKDVRFATKRESGVAGPRLGRHCPLEGALHRLASLAPGAARARRPDELLSLAGLRARGDNRRGAGPCRGDAVDH